MAEYSDDCWYTYQDFWLSTLGKLWILAQLGDKSQTSWLRSYVEKCSFCYGKVTAYLYYERRRESSNNSALTRLLLYCQYLLLVFQVCFLSVPYSSSAFYCTRKLFHPILRSPVSFPSGSGRARNILLGLGKSLVRGVVERLAF